MPDGLLNKMRVEAGPPVQYALPVGETLVPLNERVGQRFRFEYLGEIQCIACGRSTKKSFNQGYCYPCSQNLARCDICIVRPEKCHFAEGTCREPEWGLANCMRTHVVYLAASSGVKVGITRGSQIPTRWIDQGALRALPIFNVKDRYTSGRVETALKAFISDRTDWRRMLKGEIDESDLVAKRDALMVEAESMLAGLVDVLGDDAIEPISDGNVVSFDYPVTRYPDKVKSLNLDKEPVVDGVLQGIRGQYLILDSGVINMRKYGGYRIRIEDA